MRLPYYRFLNDTSFNWTGFLLLLSAKVTGAFSSLTRPERVKVLVLDDSVVKRNRSKAVELLARVYDHVEHKYQKGFTMLTLGCPAGKFVPENTGISAFRLLSELHRKIRDSVLEAYSHSEDDCPMEADAEEPEQTVP